MIMAVLTALWLGILTSISPCPLATNVAGVAFVGGISAAPRRVLAAGFLYALGRTAAYVGLAMIAVFSFSRLLAASSFFQDTFYKLLGPLLIVVGMVLVGLISFRMPLRGSAPAPERIRGGRLWAAAPLGLLFALSFCPVSAALFFGMLIPLAIQHESVLAIPAAYGIATGLPVALFAVLIALGLAKAGSAFRATARIERWMRPVTGGVLILVGVYETLRGVFGLI
jgi:cytochrome c-type biogenesis protein